MIEVWLASDGSVKGVKIAESRGSQVFHEVSLKAIAATRYKPGVEVTCKSLFTYTVS